MKHARRLILIAAAVSAALLAAAGPAAAGPPAADAGPEAVATAYLKARAVAVTALDPGAPLALLVAPGSGLAARERLIARGAGLNALKLGHFIDAIETAVTVNDVSVAAGGTAATVAAHVITTLTWHSRDGLPDVEGSGVDHTVSLAKGPRGWRVTGDVYDDVMVPAYLEDAGSTGTAAFKAARDLERAAAGRIRARIRGDRALVSVDQPQADSGAAGGRGYMDIITYNRTAAAAYADRYALSYNPSMVRFGADCANFVSQSTRGGGMPTAPGTWDTGWWYNNKNTSSPADDQYSWSWINVAKQMAFWNGTRTDWVPSIGYLGKGDAVYYDWSGDGVWDHVAIVVGSNSAGQKVIDAHTTDHYRVYWKLGYSTTKYMFGRVRAQWIV
jgi:hypothetical protein